MRETLEVRTGCFNPRLRAGGDCANCMAREGIASFNPRLRAGGDSGDGFLPKEFPVSIHASAREATLSTTKRASGKNVSIHASAREATPMLKIIGGEG